MRADLCPPTVLYNFKSLVSKPHIEALPHFRKSIGISGPQTARDSLPAGPNPIGVSLLTVSPSV
jgi:hypothetical protein